MEEYSIRRNILLNIAARTAMWSQETGLHKPSMYLKAKEIKGIWTTSFTIRYVRSVMPHSLPRRQTPYSALKDAENSIERLKKTSKKAWRLPDYRRLMRRLTMQALTRNIKYWSPVRIAGPSSMPWRSPPCSAAAHAPGSSEGDRTARKEPRR